MASVSKRQTTFAKHQREQAVREKRARKQSERLARKQEKREARLGVDPETGEPTLASGDEDVSEASQAATGPPAADG